MRKTTAEAKAAAKLKRLQAARAKQEARLKQRLLERAAKTVTEERYRKILERLGLSVTGAAEVFGFSPRQSQRYAAGDEIPEPTAKLLRLAERGRLTAEEIMKI